jgi:dTDP-4-dehydrorhamnose reductase
VAGIKLPKPIRMTKILLTGKTGQLGFELQHSLKALGDVVAVGSVDCDFTDLESLRRLVQKIRPDIIVNPAAYTAVDKAENDSHRAELINSHAPQVIGEEAFRLGAQVIHYSTDYVFDGEQSTPYVEVDLPNPQSVYGKTKLQGELALAASGARHMIWRTSWVVGAHGNNFAKTMLRLSGERESINVVSDQFGAPTSAALLAELTAKVILQCRSTKPSEIPNGIYHVSASGSTNWCDYAKFVVQHAVQSGYRFKTGPATIHPITSINYPTPAKRPANSRLNTQKFCDTFALNIPEWQVGVRSTLDEILRAI